MSKTSETVYIHRPEKWTKPITSGLYTELTFRDKRVIKVYEQNDTIFLLYNNDNVLQYTKRPNSKHIFDLVGNTVEGDGNVLFNRYSKARYLTNQVFIQNNVLYLPVKLNGYLEFGPTNTYTQLEKDNAKGIRSFLYDATESASYGNEETQLDEGFFFMTCGKTRFIPGDIRPIE